MKYLILSLLFSINLQAEVLLKDVGIVGLMSHDLFTWDRVNEVNTENGRLDLSTIFDYQEGRRWKKGGNPKNAENSPVYSITMELVEFYKNALKTHSPETARKKTVKRFHEMVKDSFQRVSGLQFPETGIDDAVNNIEQAALRGLHDILPGRAKLYGRPFLKDFALTNFLFAKLRLNEKELNQKIAYFDGDYAQEFKNIKIPFTKKTINLKTIDRDFIEKFSPYNQVDMLRELGLVGKGEMALGDVFFMHHIFELVSKGICPNENKWMPQEINCL